MIERISGAYAATMAGTAISNVTSGGIHDMSPNEMDQLSLDMFEHGEMTLRERLPFAPLDTSPLEDAAGVNISLGYYSQVWDDPDRKRDMARAFRDILSEQIRNGEPQMNIDMTRSALSVLDRIAQYALQDNIRQARSGRKWDTEHGISNGRR